MEVPNTKENIEKCICKDCPTYNECMSNGKEALYCSIGGSNCKTEKLECICEQCHINEEYNLTANLDLMEKMILHLNNHYCINGPAK